MRIGDWLGTRCVWCGALDDTGHGLCGGCRRDLPPVVDPCPRCAEPGVGTSCARCRARAPRFDAIVCAYHYGGGAAELVQRLKFSADLAAARALGHGLALAAARLVWDAAPCVVAMPAHWTRLLRRGFNPAAEIARWVARERAWPVDGRLLRRRRGGPAQSSAADEAARRRNVRGAFVAARRRQVPAHVALVDDVVTTGATVDAAARALQSVGVRRVTVLAATRAGRGQ